MGGAMGARFSGRSLERPRAHRLPQFVDWPRAVFPNETALLFAARGLSDEFSDDLVCEEKEPEAHLGLRTAHSQEKNPPPTFLPTSVEDA